MIRIALLGLCFVLAGCAESVGSYGLKGVWQADELEPGLWKVIGFEHVGDYDGAGMDTALFRAAELSKENGFPYFQVLNDTSTTTSAPTGPYSSVDTGFWARLLVQGAKEINSPLDCQSEVSTVCRTHAVENIMSEVGPRIRAQADARRERKTRR